MRLCLDFISVNLKSQMQYKMSFLLTVAGQFITAFTAWFGLIFVLQKVEAIDGFTKGQVSICYAVIMLSFSIGELIGAGFAVFARILGDGEFDRILCRPGGILLQVLAPHMDFVRIGLLLQAVLVLALVISGCGISWTAGKAALLFLMVLSGSAVFFSLFLLNASFSFFTVESLQFLDIFTYGARDFGRYPFSIYGEKVLKFLTCVIPLALVQYYPLLYLTDRETNGFYALCPVLALLFLVPCVAFFYYGVRKYKSTGS